MAIEHANGPVEGAERPFGVALIALLQLVNSAAVGASILFDRSLLPVFVGEDAAAPVGVGQLALGLVIAVGLWTLRSWAWTATMLWVGVVLAGSLHRYFDGEPNYFSMGISLAQVFYLNQREVQRAFGRGAPETADAG